jgi:hypothetical protein
LVLAGAITAPAEVLYEQTGFSGAGYFADGVAGQFYDQRIAESFTLGGAASVDQITWHGGSENFVFPDLTNFSSFWLRIYADAAGAVGAEVWSGNFSTANTNPVINGVLVGGGNGYDHTVNTGGIALAGGTYWLSVGSVNVSPGDDAYAWSQSTNFYDNSIAAEIGFGSGYQIFPGNADVVFGIHGVPEPGTFLAIGAGLLGLLATRRRR